MLPQLVSQKTAACSSYWSCTCRVKCHGSYTHGARQGTGFPVSHFFHFHRRVLLCIIIAAQGSYGKVFIGCSQKNLCDVYGLMERGRDFKNSFQRQWKSVLFCGQQKSTTLRLKTWFQSCLWWPHLGNASVISQVSLLFCTDRHNCTHAHTYQSQDTVMTKQDAGHGITWEMATCYEFKTMILIIYHG